MPSLDNACLIRWASADDAARIGVIARAAYAKYIARMGREPAPMAADFAAEIAANHVVVIELTRTSSTTLPLTPRGKAKVWVGS